MLGDLSANYESNGDPATISSGYGDLGGASYGAYQFASNMGVVDDFVAWLASEGYPHADTLVNAGGPGNPFFNQAWIYVADIDRDGFMAKQHEYVMDRYYDSAVWFLERAGYHADKHSNTMQDVIWSRAVQYGPALIVEMFETAASIIGHPNLSYVDDISFDADMIRSIYLNVCMSDEWTNGSPGLREGLHARFQAECNDALEMLSCELAG